MAAVEAECARHGLVVSKSKSVTDPRRTLVCLGTEIDLDDFVFRIPLEKKTKICEGIDELLAEARSSPDGCVAIRSLAVTIGRIMATHLSVGDVARRETRSGYAFVASLTGVPPDATRRELKVAWDCRGVMPAVVIDELVLWRGVIMGHAGTPIRELAVAPCSITTVLTPAPSLVL